MSHTRLTQWLLMTALVLTVGCDRVTKHAAMKLADQPVQSYLGDTVRLQYAENAGGFLSLGATLPSAARTVVFGIGPAVMLGLLVATAIRSRWTGLALVGATLVASGGMSNWIDRVMRGTVIDFLNVGVGGLRTGIFNVADVAVMAGVALLVISISKGTSKTPAVTPTPDDVTI